MRTLAKAAASSLVALGIGLAFAVVCVAAIGILGTRSSSRQGNQIASDVLATSTATGRLAREMDMAYATGQVAFLAAGPAERSRLLGSLYTRLLPATDARLSPSSVCTRAILKLSTPGSSSSSGSGLLSAISSARQAWRPIRRLRSPPSSRPPISR